MVSKDKSMTTRSDRTQSAVTKVGADFPGFLAAYAENDDSLSGVVERRIVPRIKIIQQMTDTKLKAQYGEGSAVLVQAGLKIASAGESFHFVPIFYYEEWITWGDRRDPNSPMIIEKSTDPNSEVAMKAQDPDRRFEEYAPPPKKGERPLQRRHVEHLNFVGVLYGSGGERVPVVISFSRGEHYAGCNFCTAISTRRVGKAIAPLWSQVWKMTVNLRERDGNKWFGLDASNPDPEIQSAYIMEEEAEEFKQQFELFKSLHKMHAVEVDRTDEDDADEVSVSSTDADHLDGVS